MMIGGKGGFDQQAGQFKAFGAADFVPMHQAKVLDRSDRLKEVRARHVYMCMCMHAPLLHVRVYACLEGVRARHVYMHVCMPRGGASSPRVHACMHASRGCELADVEAAGAACMHVHAHTWRTVAHAPRACAAAGRGSHPQANGRAVAVARRLRRPAAQPTASQGGGW